MSMTRRSTTIFAIVLQLWAVCLLLLPQRVDAHFSYSDPRIVHVTESDKHALVILLRMPAPLALLPADWQGSKDTRLPPFAMHHAEYLFLDLNALRANQDAFHQLLLDGLTVWLSDQPHELLVGRSRFWLDTERPSFGTVKSALNSLNSSASTTALPYLDATLDVEFIVPAGSLTAPIRISSNLGANFQVIDKFGSIVKLHRDSGTETAAMIGLLRADFPGIQAGWVRYLNSALIGAEHIYLGFDHLAMIVLIAIAASGWRQALLWASAFTIGHVLTLALGLYGFVPQGRWFINSVELLIILSIVAAGTAIALRMSHALNRVTMFVIGLIHGYGFASAANVALFSGEVNVTTLVAFAFGLELCQFTVYLVILPIIVLLDKTDIFNDAHWRRPVAFALAAAAGVSVVHPF